MLLLDLVHRHTDRTVISYSFRGRAPLFDPAPFRLVGQPEDDAVALEAQPSRFALASGLIGCALIRAETFASWFP